MLNRRPSPSPGPDKRLPTVQDIFSTKVSCMDIAPLFAAVGVPGSFWDAPSNVYAVVLLVFAAAAIGLALGLAKVFKRFNGAAWAVLGAGILIAGYALWLMAS